jgi:hypothetical protein
MSERASLRTRLVAAVRALLPVDWLGRAGNRFRDTSEAISEFAEQHGVRPRDLAEQGVELGKRKLEGLANKEYAEALKNFADAEQKKIEATLQQRSFESKVRKEEALARKEEAEARFALLKVVNAEMDLLVRLKDTRVVLHQDAAGNLTVLPAPPTVDMVKLAERRRLELASDEGVDSTKHGSDLGV